MATKRPAPQVHPSRHGQVPSELARKRRKPNIKAGAGAKSFKKAHPVNELKSRIRSLKRQLERNDSLTAVEQMEKERALQTAQRELEQNQRATQRNEMIGRWHKVRFFDRKKAEKRLKRARKELETGEGTPSQQQRVRDAEVDVKYAVYYPLEKPYAPLFPRRKGSEEDEDEDGAAGEDGAAREVERKGDPEMWGTVKRCMADGTLDALRNGGLTAARQEDEGSGAGQATTERPGQLSTGRDRNGEAESDDESDDGGNSRFFE